MRGAERGANEGRAQNRLVPLNRILVLTRANGRSSIGRVENVSRSGIAFTSNATFETGEAIRVCGHPATIVRVFDDGAAADFEPVLELENFDVMISFARCS